MASAYGVDSKPSVPLRLIPCKYCNRTFSGDALTRHQPVCIKRSVKQRRPFNSFRQRIEGTEITKFVGAPRTTLRSTSDLQSRPRTADRNAGNGSGRNSSMSATSSSTSAKRKPSWRQQHEELVNAIRNARLAKLAIQSGLPLPPPPPPSLNPDYIQCPYCLRRFNETAAERHISFCKGKALNPPQMKSSSDLKSRPVKPCNSCPGTPSTSTSQHAAPPRPPNTPQRSSPVSASTVRGTRYSGQPTRVNDITASTGCKSSPRVSTTAQYSEGRAIGKVGSRTVTPGPVPFEGASRAAMSSGVLRGSGSASRVVASPLHSARRVSAPKRYDVRSTAW